MAVRIEKIHSCSKNKIYHVTIHDRIVGATVTSSPSAVNRWVKIHLHAPSRRHHKIVGLDVEWRPSFTSGIHNPVAILQLCFRKCCLIYQIYQAFCIPVSLYLALSNPNITYTGVKISGDAKKLWEDYNLEVSNTEDVAKLAADVYCDKKLKKAGLKALVEDIFGEEIDKSWHVTMSNWDAKLLTRAQVKYASVDAYYSYKLGKFLLSDD